MASFKVTFTLDDDDAKYFRSLYSRAKRGAKVQDSTAIIREAQGIVKRVRSSKKTPRFVIDAIEVLADLTDLVQDEAYAAPKKVRDSPSKWSTRPGAWAEATSNLSPPMAPQTRRFRWRRRGGWSSRTVYPPSLARSAAQRHSSLREK